MDAFKAEDECPFCYIERLLEQQALRFVLGPGASYMEDDIRAGTDRLGFCRTHFKKMYDYGNRLGCGLILSTHIKEKTKTLSERLNNYKPTKISPLSRFKKTHNSTNNELVNWLHDQVHSCYICNHIQNTYQRYLDTFFDLYKHNPDFLPLLQNCKGFCLMHFEDIIKFSDFQLSEKGKENFYHILFPIMIQNFQRIQSDMEWFCEKFDYRNRNADWKTSKDAIPRTMQKITGGYAADPIYTQD